MAVKSDFGRAYYNQLHNKRIDNYVHKIKQLYIGLISEIVKLNVSAAPDKPFQFDDYPLLRARVNAIFDEFANNLDFIIKNGSEQEWVKACKENDAFINAIMKTSSLIVKQLEGYQDRNLEALKSFQNRKIDGFTISDRVWRYTKQLKKEIELGLDIGIGEGRSADQLSRELRGYLQEPEKLFRRVRNKHGALVLSKTAANYHPGQGIYRSSYKNAVRLTRNETNIAYKESDFIRWQKLDFVVGIEIKLSNNHTLNGRPFYDMCDELQGRYPKTFKFIGWHVQCRCFAIPILMTAKEIQITTQMLKNGEDITAFRSMNEVRDLPANFKLWVERNKVKISRAKKKPDFIKNLK